MLCACGHVPSSSAGPLRRSPRACSSCCAPASGAPSSAKVSGSSASSAFGGGGSSAAYATAKAGLAGLTRELARGLAPAVRVNGIAPGYVNSNWECSFGDVATAAHETVTFGQGRAARRLRRGNRVSVRRRGLRHWRSYPGHRQHTHLRNIEQGGNQPACTVSPALLVLRIRAHLLRELPVSDV